MAEVTDVVADVAEQVATEALEVAEVSRSLSGRDLTIGLFLGGAIGAGAAYLLLRKRLETKYDKYAEAEINEMREHFQARLIAREKKPDLAVEAQKVEKISEDEGYSSPNTPKPTDKPSLEQIAAVHATNEELNAMTEENAEGFDSPEHLERVFDTVKEADEGWDQEHEENMRTPTKPYIIHYDEQGQKNYTEATFVYYAGDDVLSDARDNVVDPDKRDDIVGEDNLSKFGHGSKDKNVVYIRNDAMAADFEIVKNDGDYAEIVHGFVKHEDYEPTQKRRRHLDDESS